MHWKTKKKKKKPFRGKSETEVTHIQSFTDFNQKKKLYRRFREDISVSILPNRVISVKNMFITVFFLILPNGRFTKEIVEKTKGFGISSIQIQIVH